MDRDALARLLATHPAAIERALTALYVRQTDDERSCGDTRHRNGAGFNANDARFLTSLALQVERQRSRLGGYRLSPRQHAAAGRLLPKYAGQLLACGVNWNQFASSAARGEELRAMEELAASLLENTGGRH